MDIKKEVKDAASNVRDATNEALHRSSAEAERTRRDVLGDEMKPGEKIESGANELKNRVQAEIDKSKREVRDRT